MLSLPVTAQEQPTSVYDYNTALDMDFIPKMELLRVRQAESQDAYWQNSADYKINISLDEEKKHFTGPKSSLTPTTAQTS